VYAVIKSGGKQYRVGLGDVIRVERLAADPGDTISLDQVLMVKGESDVQLGTPMLSDVVTCTVKGHGRGKKIRVFKMRRRKNYRRQAGHRQGYTELQVTSIAGVSQPEAPPRTQRKTARAAAEADAPKNE
jgi:large subunit ribosomal protein L21